MAPARQQRGVRARGVGRKVWLGLRAVAAVVLALTVSGAIALHLDLAITRRLVAQAANRVLLPVFRGRLTIEHLGSLGIHGIDGARVRVFDPAGKVVLVADGVHARILTRKLVRALLASPMAVDVEISEAAIDHVDLLFNTDEAGVPLVAAAFTPTPAEGPRGNKLPLSVLVFIERANIRQAWVHGHPTWGPLLDADVRDVDARVVFRSAGEAASVEVDVRHASLVARAPPLSGGVRGDVQGHVRVRAEDGDAAKVDGTLKGTFLGVETGARFSLAGNVVSATLDLDEVLPENVRLLLPGYPLQDVLSAHVGAHGSLPRLEFDVRARLRRTGSVVASGWTDLSQPKTMELHATFGGVDLRSLAVSLPASSLGGVVHTTVSLDAESNLTGQANVAFKQGTLGPYVLPALEAKGTFADSARFGRRADATVTVRDAKVTGMGTLRLAPKDASYELAFDGNAQATKLDAVSRAPLRMRGSARASARGVLALDTLTLSANLGGEASNLEDASLASPGTRVKHATGTAHVSGSVFSPAIEVKVHADALQAGSFRSDTLDMTAKGAVTAAHVHATLAGGNVPDMDADADVDIGATGLLRHLRIGLLRGGGAAELRADRVRIGAGSVSGDRISVLGLGEPTRGSFRITPRAADLTAHSDGVDLALVARLLGIAEWCKQGRLSLDVNAAIRSRFAEGHARIDVTGATLRGVDGVAANLDVSLGDRRLTGRLHADLGDIGTVELVGENLRMDDQEGATSLRAWQRTFGAIGLSARLDLARLGAVLPNDTLPFSAMRGRLDVEGMVRRTSMSDDAPQLTLTVKTSGLEVTGNVGAKAEGRKSPAWRLGGVDLGLDARVESETGFAELATRITDAKGPILALDVKTATMPYAALARKPEDARDLLSELAFEAHLVVPKRELATLPRALELPPEIEGVFEADLTAKGTLADPTLNLRASLNQVSASSARISLPLDLELVGAYAGGHADATLTAALPHQGEVLRAVASVERRLTDIIWRRGDPEWHADARVHVAGFPLGAVGLLEDRQVRGELSGDVDLKGLHQDASLALDLGVAGMQVGEVLYKEAHVHALLDGGALVADASVDHTDGSASAHAHAGAAWGAGLWPHLDANQPLDLSLMTHELRAETLLPFAHDILAELEGRINGTAHVTFDPKESEPKLDGRVTLQHGKFELSSALGEFHDAEATVVLTPDGAATLENASARGVTGKVEMSASARMNGLSLGAVRADIEIPSNAAIPVTVEGAPLGTIDGTIRIVEDPTPDGRGMKVGVDVPTLHVELPQSGSRDVQSLGEIQAARIQARRGRETVPILLAPPGEPKVRAAGAKRIEVTLHLGNDVEVRRGTDLKVQLGGQPTITITDTEHLSGQLRLEKGGVLAVQGKSFEIENGTITFDGDDPSNPQVVVTAVWVAPEGTRVYANYIGPLKTGKVTFRSEPPLARSDIVALLVFGTTGSSSAVAQGNSTNSAAASSTYSSVGLAGGVAAQPINHALDQFGIHRISAKVDTSLASNPKPEVELQVAKDISLQLAYVLGTPPPGTNPDTTLLTLNWRFLKSWSLATTVGNAGTSIVDMIWQRRY